MEKMSMSSEDYLEAMVSLGGSPKTPIRSVDVASVLGVSKASVNKAMSLLKENGMADQPRYGDITLTKKGYEYGRSVLNRHLMLTGFLADVLGVPIERAAEEACQMEHAISDDTFERWQSYYDELDVPKSILSYRQLEKQRAEK